MIYSNKYAQHTLSIDSCIGLFFIFPFDTIFDINCDSVHPQNPSLDTRPDVLPYIVAWTASTIYIPAKNHGKPELCRQWVLSPIGAYELGIAK